MQRRFTPFLSTGLFLFTICSPIVTSAAGFAEAYQDCMNGFKTQPEYMRFCEAQTCAYRACIADHRLGIYNGDVVIPGGGLTVVPAECSPHVQVMQQCIIQHLNDAIQPEVQIGSIWRVVESCSEDTWVATWTRRPGTDTFDAVWTKTRGADSGNKFQDVIDFKGVSDGQVTLYRHGLNGTYTGNLSADGGKVRNGGATWYPSTCSWTAEIKK